MYKFSMNNEYLGIFTSGRSTPPALQNDEILAWCYRKIGSKVSGLIKSYWPFTLILKYAPFDFSCINWILLS